MIPFVTHIRTTETKPVVVGQVQGYVISSIIFCDTEATLPYCFLRYHSIVPINQQGTVIATNVTRESGIPFSIFGHFYTLFFLSEAESILPLSYNLLPGSIVVHIYHCHTIIAHHRLPYNPFQMTLANLLYRIPTELVKTPIYACTVRSLGEI